MSCSACGAWTWDHETAFTGVADPPGSITCPFHSCLHPLLAPVSERCLRGGDCWDTSNPWWGACGVLLLGTLVPKGKGLVLVG